MSATGGSLRVALLSPTYWPEVRRGTERFVRDLADGLLAAGHRPTLITSHPGVPSRTVEGGLEVVRVWRPPEGRLRRRAFQPHVSHVPLSYLALLRGDFDLAHALYPTDALAAARWARRRWRPSVVSFMGLPDRASLVGVRGRVATVRRVAREMDAAVALSAVASEAFRELLGIETRAIAAGVDLDAFTPGGERAPTPTVFCPAALDDPRKRVDLLVAALARVRGGRPDARLVLVLRPGQQLPPEWARAGVSALDVDDRGALVAAYRSAWVTVLASRWEAFGLVLVESLACGTPVVAAADGALPEIVRGRPQIGGVFDADDVDSLARALLATLELAGEPGTGERCRERALDFPVQRCVQAYLGLYREVLASGRRPRTP